MVEIISESIIVRPPFHDLDPMNIVWHGNYARYFEEARAALMNRIGYGYEAMFESGYAWPVIDLSVRYYRPLRLGRPMRVRATLVEWEHRLRIRYLIRDEETGRKATRGQTVQVAVDARTEEMLWETPDIFREKLAPFLS